MSIWKEFVICPYNRNHIIRKYNVQYHIPTCKEKHQNVFFLTCRFNCQRLCQEDREFLCQAVPENIGSKSKRRRDKIRERQAQKVQWPRGYEPTRYSSSRERVVKMDNQQEFSDLGEEQGAWGAWGALTGLWEEPVKMKAPKKNPVGASNDKAQPSLEAADQRSKTAKKRSQKKQRKEKGIAKANVDTANNVPADNSNEKKEYVIKLSESVSVTETNRARKEVYIHYPTKKLLSPDSVGKDNLGIQPMMLQRICFEAFMRMQHSNGEGSRGSPFVNGNKTKRGFHGTARGATSSVNEDENKTIQGSSEATSGSPSSGMKKDNNTTQASDFKRNADLYYPKRYRPKKDKKKWNANLTTTAPYKSASLEESELQDRFAKYMIREADEYSAPKHLANQYNFPPPYLESEVRQKSRYLEYPAEREDYGVHGYLRDDEWANENENQP